MDIKSRNTKPFWAWLSFFLAVSILVLLLINSLAYLVYSDGNTDALRATFGGDYKNTKAFKERTANYFNNLFVMVTANSQDEYSRQLNWQHLLEVEGNNLRYYAVDHGSNLEVTDTQGEISLSNSGGPPSIPADYTYYWYFDG